MSSYLGDIATIYGGASTEKTATKATQSGKTTLDMTDFLTLMVAQLQAQTIDDTADTSDMLNQLVQMQMVTALTNMTDASVMSYAGSLVGKEVTVADYSTGKFQEKVFTVIGTGTYGGQQAIFAEDGTMYALSDIIAVGRLPEIKDSDESDSDAGAKPPVDGVEGSGEGGDQENAENKPVDGVTEPEKTGEASEEDQETIPSVG